MKTKQKITKEMMIGEIIEKYPKLGEVLMEDYGFHCVGCMAAGMETLEQGAEVHGMSQKETKEMVASLNELVDEK